MQPDRTQKITIGIEAGNPHNDQLLAQANTTVEWYIGSVARVLAQIDESGLTDTEALAIVAAGLDVSGEDKIPRTMLTAMLGLLLVRAARNRSVQTSP